MPAEEDPVAMEDRGTPQQFCLRWNNYQSNLTSCFDQLLQTELFVDVTLACEGQKLKAHKLVLSACSPYFQELLTDNPCQHPIIIMNNDIKYCDLKAVVYYMYRGEINVSEDQIPALLKVAEALKIRGLTDVNASSTLVGAEARASKRAASRERSPGRARRRLSESRGRRASTPSPAPSAEPAAAAAPPAPPAPPMPPDDADIRPGIAEMIREEERARLIENSHAWLGPSTSALADSYQYQLQSMWQKCWNTNQNLVHNLRFRERGPLKSWRPETMAEAIFSVLKEGLSLSQAARKYDIPYPTFVLYANRVHNMLGPSADGGAGWITDTGCIYRGGGRQWTRRARVSKCCRRRRRSRRGPWAAPSDVQHGGGGAAPTGPAATRPASAANALTAAAVTALREPGITNVLPEPDARGREARRSIPPVHIAPT
ncbi:protein bric-a-brac 1 isoform X2 [Bombyx mori]|uniref:protein bric-a-brac 1 isoform X2 n=1 Tax=Bombyx mori TaxID=7091 RepID=UPI000B3C7592